MRALLAGTGGILKIARHIWEVDVAGWPVTGRRRGGGGVLNITAAVWTAAFQWWRSGDITRAQNVSEYMLYSLYASLLLLLYEIGKATPMRGTRGEAYVRGMGRSTGGGV